MTELKNLKYYFELFNLEKKSFAKRSYAKKGICWKCREIIGVKGLEKYSALCFKCLIKVIQSDLRQEAINDIKELLKITKENSVHSLPIKFEDFLINPSNNFREIFRIIDYIKWKFNITEEDLK